MNLEDIKNKYIKLLRSISDLDIKDVIALNNIMVTELQLSYLIDWSKSIKSKRKQNKICKACKGK